ncbi:conserved hypothetical protein [Ricinus communis]|uniref:Uncharacterized protein n=1 Tax=Ricinus communis TaxID=3988 RepID=B9S0R2_RICCO|nr:conserved hypothetical protein [Ricinus communis]
MSFCNEFGKEGNGRVLRAFGWAYAAFPLQQAWQSGRGIVIPGKRNSNWKKLYMAMELVILVFGRFWRERGRDKVLGGLK